MRTWLRRIGRGVATLGIGAALGFLVPKVVADYTPDPQIQAQVAESSVARAFIEAYVANDTAALRAMGITTALQLRASRLASDYASVSPPVHLGSYVAPGFLLHDYTARVTDDEGASTLLAWRIVSVGGQIGLLDPPQADTAP